MLIRRRKWVQLPSGPDELLGFTQGGKLWIGIALMCVVLVALVWTAFAIA
jgi:hypothetical protein